MQVSGQTETAVKLALRIWNESAGDPEAAMLASEVLSADVPEWHFRLIRDRVRNAAYDAALRRAIRPGTRVLDIGSGTGLLAMMAARAGAAEVVTCEMVPVVAEKAAQIVASNGYAGHVRVIGKHSKKLDVEADLGGRADILVSEIVSDDLLEEDVLGAHEHAVRDLLRPGARVIPSSGAVRVALAFDARSDPDALENVSGFDLSAFAALARTALPVRVGSEHLALKSEAADLFVFDFASAQYRAPARAQVGCVSLGGPVNGVVQWIALQLDELTRYENRPAPGATSHWRARFHPFAQAIDTAAGDGFRIQGSHDRRSLTIWAEQT